MSITGTTAIPAPVCGDGFVEGAEVCDDGDQDDTNSCTNACVPARCGDGLLGPDETCDDGPNNGPTHPCTPDCAVNVCGDGHLLTLGEACDDGNDIDTDACRNDCTVPACGDNRLDDGEACDDGNAIDTDACIACTKASCGDGFLQMNVEVCDLGADNGVYGGACSVTCDGPGPSCGDGVWDPVHELCDGDGAPEGADCEAGCKPKCEFSKVDCNNDLTDGCQDIYSDKNNCGVCDEKCPNVCILKVCY